MFTWNSVSPVSQVFYLKAKEEDIWEVLVAAFWHFYPLNCWEVILMNSRCGKENDNKAPVNGKIHNVFQTFSRRLNFCTLFVVFKCAHLFGYLFLMRQVIFMPMYKCPFEFTKIKQKENYSWNSLSVSIYCWSISYRKHPWREKYLQ